LHHYSPKNDAMKKPTFEELLEAFPDLLQTASNTERLVLLLLKNSEPQTDPERWFNLHELCNYLPDKPAKATVYGWVHAGSIPYHKDKGQKKLRFLKSELDLWLSSGKRKTVTEIAAEANQYIEQRKKGGRHE
jgi:excisionase family DNA binding protein